MVTRAGAERIERRCRDQRDDRPARAAVLAELRRSVPFDAYAWVMTDPETAVGTSPLAEAPAPLPALIKAKYLTKANRWTALPARRAHNLPDPGESLVWREVQRTHGVTDIASVRHADRYGCWGFLDLWRTGGQFSAAELDFLTAVATPMTTMLRGLQARAFDRTTDTADTAGPVVLVLSPDLEVRAQTATTDAYLRSLIPPTDERPPVPAAAYNVAAQLLAVEAGVDDHASLARVHLAPGRWVTLRAERLAGDIAVTMERSTPAERLAVFRRAMGLSAREGELLSHLADGHATADVARLMVLSEHTVQDHIKAIFTKTASHSRAALLSRING
ncbi:transcriptional regulator, LuxR family [Alloactinosynnema sp. L-07]|uniref:response regulator transcription factor n=1 Tax=Alloactinosynnema sp. L-07 TaxID=1653480 RepID=UPI00065F0426|nr:helix-turn-helix transcriptional regulator [Alloactinosynnema sp. L-07]CRK60379.1 transcriptional regulator, LuxR family [Alloactinosynnema sp. L-07]